MRRHTVKRLRTFPQLKFYPSKDILARSAGWFDTRHPCCYKTALIGDPVDRNHFGLIAIKDRKRLANQKARPFP